MKSNKVLFFLLYFFLLTFQTGQAGRMYDPEISRFLNIDPALHEQMPQQLLANHPSLLSDSPYSYGYNNPLRFTDPDGKTPWDILDIAFAVMSVKDAIQDPSASNIFWASVDVLAAAAPIVPSSRGARMALNAIDAVDDVTDAVKAVDKVEDVASGVEKINKNANNAEGNFALYEVKDADGNVLKVGKADADRVNSAGQPKRMMDSQRKARRDYPGATAEMLPNSNSKTTSAAKEAEAKRVREHRANGNPLPINKEKDKRYHNN